ncbi:MAG: hypothetical protein Nkreftii_000289 [Candidatus Nitrospira kreftii]|uniref:Uncharacterized protein n=1 Tax=Candidatus Nitrospira kreftii TaxID=2652173 RepID=A0A7S8FB09_9BACT|nr:MAG: hypothetical protein Nkreftii_000289 [Candidatus Nitrospira kreftii]
MGIVWRARQSSVLADRARKIDLMITVRVVLVRGAQLRTDVPPRLGEYRRRIRCDRLSEYSLHGRSGINLVGAAR